MESVQPGVTLAPDEATVFEAIGSGEAHINEIAERCSPLSGSLVSATLMKLEIKRVVKPLPGKFYVRLV
ncbi:hypothetical protein [Verrucomicrobium spinosum]|nr:hypothetical protein [Verrucomicrobium spinosum]